MEHTVGIRKILCTPVDLHSQVLVKKLVGSGCSEKLDKSRCHAFPTSGAKLLDIVLQELLQA